MPLILCKIFRYISFSPLWDDSPPSLYISFAARISFAFLTIQANALQSLCVTAQCVCVCESNAIVVALTRGCRARPEQSMRLASLIFQMFKDVVPVSVWTDLNIIFEKKKQTNKMENAVIFCVCHIQIAYTCSMESCQGQSPSISTNIYHEKKKKG